MTIKKKKDNFWPPAVYEFTQGQKKMRQILKELQNNEVFNKELDSIRKISDFQEQECQILALFEKYSLPQNSRAPFLYHILRGDDIDSNSPFMAPDVCAKLNEVDEYLREIGEYNFDRPALSELHSSDNPKELATIKAFPIRIGISPNASKRDVLDFIRKRWPVIKEELSQYGSNPKIRKRPKEKRNDFIWRHKDLSPEEIVDLVEKEFGITYGEEEINSILRTEERRRVRDLSNNLP